MRGKSEAGPGRRKLAIRHLCQRYDVCARTIDRWTQAGILPKPMTINKIRYWDEEEVEQRDQERLAAARNDAAG